MEIREFTLTSTPKVYAKDKNGQPWQYGGVKVMFTAAECGQDTLSGFFPADHELIKLHGGAKITLMYEQNGKWRNVKPVSKQGEKDAKYDEAFNRLAERVFALEQWREKHVKFHANQTLPKDLAEFVPPIPEKEDVTTLPF